MNNNAENNKYSKTIEEVVEMLEKFQKEHGGGSLANRESKEWKEGYARAVSDILWIIL